jgi:glycosyltransferase involved in cell wall biosynthesis
MKDSKRQKAQSELQGEDSVLEKPSDQLSAFGFRLGYDGKRAANNVTGLGNYSRSLIEQLANDFPANRYFIYTPKAKSKLLALPIFAKNNVEIRFPSAKINLLWRSFTIKKQLQQDKIDLFHGLSHEIPFGMKDIKIKSVVTIHDLIFLRRPQYYRFIDRNIYRFKSEYACKNADKIIAISEQTKQDIVALYQIDPAKIEVIYQSCDDSFKRPCTVAEKEKIRQKYQLPDQYLLAVGTVEARKNLLLLIRALPKIANGIPLVIIGKATAYAKLVTKAIEQLGLKNRIIWLNHVPFADLPAIYQMATLFVYPSFYEGFGIPIIEALYGNVPVVAAKGSCLEEAGGPNSLYFSPDDQEELVEVVNRVLGNVQLQLQMKENGLRYVQKFNSEIVNQQLINCYLNTMKQ